MSLKLLPRTLALSRPILPVQARRPFFTLPSLPSLLSSVSPLASSSSSTGRTTTGGGPDGDEHHYVEEKILPYTPRELYSIVANVPSYSKFVPFCTESTVLSPSTPSSLTSSPSSSTLSRISHDQPFDVEAELRIGFMGFSEGYVSKVKGRPFDSVEAIASSTPLFKTLITTWTFRPAVPVQPSPSQSSVLPADMGPTLVTLDLTWSFNSQTSALASGVFFGTASGMMVRAFEGRVRGVYGDRSM
ncbi:dehydrase and lipid transport-domain-containing protein [Mrakia frigida]|uniref:ubiquinone-binding protein COQ10 n=1 Tax=Mrakia frigida TaxID=29902 RepID=UPI003FCC1CFB